MGPIAGLAAGLGLAALMSHLGMGEAFGNFLMLALLGVLAVVAIGFVMRRFGRGNVGGRPRGHRLSRCLDAVPGSLGSSCRGQRCAADPAQGLGTRVGGGTEEFECALLARAEVTGGRQLRHQRWDPRHHPELLVEPTDCVVLQNRGSHRPGRGAHDPLSAAQINAAAGHLMEIGDLPGHEEDPSAAQRQAEMEAITVPCTEITGNRQPVGRGRGPREGGEKA
jgi:hypothetical protein